MNYFELFGLSPAFIIDKARLRKSYYEKSRAYHPDRFSMLDAEKQMNAMEKSSRINEAYKILSDDQARIRYVLEISGIEFDEGKETVPQEFLMDIMDINEAIMEYKMEQDESIKEDVLKRLSDISSEMKTDVEELFEKFNFGKAEKKQLELIKDYYLKRKYLDRIVSNLDN